MTTIADVAGMDRRSATRLRQAGIRTAEAFSQKARNRQELRALSEQTGIDPQRLSDIATSVDLLRVDGLGSRYCALLRAAGIHTVEALANSSPREILEALQAANHRTRMARRLPGRPVVQSWILQAGQTARGDA